MKNFFDGVKLFLLISGAVMGAGFLSGGELVAFFGGGYSGLLLSAVIFFIGFTLLTTSKTATPKIPLLMSSAVFSIAMLSGLDEIAGFIGVLRGIPAAPVLSIIIFHFLLSGSIKKIEKINCFLIPVSVLIVFLTIINVPDSAPKVRVASGGKWVINAVLYACMNVFVALPSVKSAAQGKKKGTKIAAFIAFSVFFAGFSYLIIRVSPNTSLPLLDISYGTPFFPLLVIALFIGSFTSLICCLYPLKSFIAQKTADKKRRGIYCFLLYAVLFLLSRVGFNSIIKYFYPLVGALGLFYIVKGAIGIKFPLNGDTKIKRSALCQERKKIKSKNLPKKNTATI